MRARKRQVRLEYTSWLNDSLNRDDIVAGRVIRHYRFIQLKEDTRATTQYLRVEDLTERKKVAKTFLRKDGSSGNVLRSYKDVRMVDWYAAQGKPLKQVIFVTCLS